MPKGLLYLLEKPFRKVYSTLFFSGKQVHCSVCDAHRRRFKTLENGNRLCTNCGSLPRQRRLKTLLNDYLNDNPSLLHFSPARCLNRTFRKERSGMYITTDYQDGYLIDEAYDLTQPPTRIDFFDAIICYHVLEHIVEDGLAMKHLHQLLKPGGMVFIQTPFKSGEIYEDFSYTTKADRLKHFGQDDHVRIYSVQGLSERLKRAGFVVDVIQFEVNETQDVKHGVDGNEVVLIAKKK